MNNKNVYIIAGPIPILIAERKNSKIRIIDESSYNNIVKAMGGI